MNESNTDRIIRLVSGVTLLLAGYVLGQEPLSTIFYVLGAVLLVTAATGFCLLYRIFGISTRK